MQIFFPTATGYQAPLLVQPLAIDHHGTLAPACNLEGDESAAAWLIPSSSQETILRAVLLAGNSKVGINSRIPLPLTVLTRGDEIQIGGISLFFTDEDPLRIVPYEPAPASGQAVSCSRCHRSLQPGEPVIFCPVCRLPYMAQADKNPNCWTFGPCLGCSRDPHVEFAWRPEGGKSVLPWQQRPGRVRTGSAVSS
jgi:hypothetical protein